MILVNGDSVTWGCELTENDDDIEYIDKYRYSSLLSAVNISQKSASNERIAWNTIRYIEKHGKPDFVIVQWGNTARFEWYSPTKKDWVYISARHVSTNFESTPNKPECVKKAGYSWYRDIDNNHFRDFNFWRQVHHLESYLSDIPHYFFIAKGNATKYEKSNGNCFYKKISKWKNMLDYTEIVGDKKTNPDNYCKGQKSWLGFDRGYGQHLSIKGHQVMAEFLNENII